ncbi:sulfotransferase domain-containing protein [Paracoccaceae bacterium]|nr:sulfotransferase domain-containing protein [Paracoccaceae bacterium]
MKKSEAFPDFVIAGTQKAATTWLEYNLNRNGNAVTPRRQLHFFDRHYERGFDWYRSQFPKTKPSQCVGEKTTEYFDTTTVNDVFCRIASSCPSIRVFIVLRNPVDRALSALQHMVNSGLEALPSDPDAILFADMKRKSGGFRYVERGYYTRQLEAVFNYIKRDQVCILIFERDIVRDPVAGWQKVCDFLGIENNLAQGLDTPVNNLRLSPLSIRLSHKFYTVPYARGAIRKLDRFLGMSPWAPVFRHETKVKLSHIYQDENEALFDLLGERISEWEIET